MILTAISLKIWGTECGGSCSGCSCAKRRSGS